MSIKDAELLVYVMLGITAFVEVYVLYLIISTDGRFKKKPDKNKDGNEKR